MKLFTASTQEEAKRNGLKFYSTGVPCKHGHIAQRRASNRGCVECERSYDQARSDSDQRRENSKRSKARHRSARRAYNLEYRAKRLKEDPEFRLLNNLRNRVRIALKRATKSGSTFDLLGCSPSELKLHMECQFQEGMTWENMGDWHIDHIRPCSSFDLTDPEQQKECFHYSNLQPLWAEDNLRKSDAW